jgi:hypothetical protein
MLLVSLLYVADFPTDPSGSVAVDIHDISIAVIPTVNGHPAIVDLCMC